MPTCTMHRPTPCRAFAAGGEERVERLGQRRRRHTFTVVLELEPQVLSVLCGCDAQVLGAGLPCIAQRLGDHPFQQRRAGAYHAPRNAAGEGHLHRAPLARSLVHQRRQRVVERHRIVGDAFGDAQAREPMGPAGGRSHRRHERVHFGSQRGRKLGRAVESFRHALRDRQDVVEVVAHLGKEGVAHHQIVGGGDFHGVVPTISGLWPRRWPALSRFPRPRHSPRKPPRTEGVAPLAPR